MKALKIMVLSLMTLSGYSPVEDTPPNTVKEYMAVWSVHDASRVAQLLIGDTVYYGAAVGEPINGRGRAEKGVIGTFTKAIPGPSWRMVGKPVYDEDTVASHWESSGKNSGEWTGSPPTNDLTKFEGVSYTHVGAGKITWRGDYYDSKRLDEELKPVKQSVVPLYK